MDKTCCCVGHEPKDLPWGDSSEGDAYNKYLVEVTFTLIEIVHDGCTHFITSLSPGANMDFAEVILWLRDEKKLEITLECAITNTDEHEKWQRTDKIRYQNILKRSDKQYFLSQTCLKTCFFTTNSNLVDHSDCLIAIKNGDKHDDIWDIIEYARTHNKEVVRIDCRNTK